MSSLPVCVSNKLLVNNLGQYVMYLHQCMIRCPFKRYEENGRSQVHLEQKEIVLEITMSRRKPEI
ncbi:hypothetical protein K9N68_00250 [Kovacikia minuta CCNUW1]|uniref:hypothetical protein n=1 Tax=Kovacikia minuta TaxID=2931930 RepID=UPI001CCF0E6B|nr:hypothetical protein [Kovacikia minuta]UBF26485.1 hypothetical protein K9N68_00250 [Kovacikia minuta CCNUW1]